MKLNIRQGLLDPIIYSSTSSLSITMYYFIRRDRNEHTKLDERRVTMLTWNWKAEAFGLLVTIAYYEITGNDT